jgi:hypothetical protein
MWAEPPRLESGSPDNRVVAFEVKLVGTVDDGAVAPVTQVVRVEGIDGERLRAALGV